MLSKANSCARS
uniref:Uncharacterized protein n=1 Tax=Anguilla anguilla TaxID=7936 RepID=A0A0E9USG1_ANGAN